MAGWSTRSSGYKVGVVVFCLASALYLLGFVSPFWLNMEFGTDRIYSGLWMGCSDFGGRTTCKGITGGEDGWFKAVEALQSVGAVSVVVAIFYAMAANVSTAPPSLSRLLEFLAAFSGVSGLIACGIFVGKLEDQADGQMKAKYYGWSFGVSVTGCLLSIVSGVVIAVANRASHTLQAALPAVLSQAGPPVAVNVTKSSAYPPVYGYDQGYPGGYYDPAAAPQLVGYAPQAGYGPAAPKAGYALMAPQTSKA